MARRYRAIEGAVMIFVPFITLVIGMVVGYMMGAERVG